MFSKTKAKPFALGLTLVLALAAAPQALADPTLGGDAGGTVVGFLADVWQSVVRLLGADDEFGPWAIPDGEPRRGASRNEIDAAVIPNGQASESSGESGPLIIPNGDRNSLEADQELGPMIIPNG